MGFGREVCSIETASPRAREERPRWSIDLAVLRGLAILLVVFGHFLPPEGSSYWLAIRRFIYDVHVPLFFVVSGLLWGSRRASPQLFDLRWLPRLVVPFMVFTLLPLAGITLAQMIPGLAMSLPAIGAEQIIAHLRNPQWGGFAVHLWFLYALAIVRFVYPLLRRVVPSDGLVLALTIVLSLAPWPGEGCLRLAALHLPLFAAGVLFGRAGLHLRQGFPGTWAAFAAVGLHAALFAASRVGPTRLLLGLCGTVLLWEIARRIRGRNRAALAALGDRSLEIYLFHPFFIPAALVLMSIATSQAAFWAIWLTTGLIATVGSWVLVRGLDRIPGAGAVLFATRPSHGTLSPMTLLTRREVATVASDRGGSGGWSRRH